jgi:hypothetical protein
MFRPSWRPSSGCVTKVDTNGNVVMNRMCRGLETLRSRDLKVSRSRHLQFIITFVLVSTLVIQPDDVLQEGRNM